MREGNETRERGEGEEARAGGEARGGRDDAREGALLHADGGVCPDSDNCDGAMDPTQLDMTGREDRDMTTDTTTDKFAELKTRARTLADNADELWTWLDGDPSVAWDDQEAESYHGKLAALYEDAGWERCYHRGARFHFNVKLNGHRAWSRFQELRNALDAERNGLLDADEFGALADRVQEWELESWWWHARDYAPSPMPFNIYSCGRSGGYLNADALNTDPVAMIELAEHCQRSRDYYNSEEWAEYLFSRTVEEYDAAKMEALASPRECVA